MATVAEAFAVAERYHHSGHFSQAAQICRQIVEAIPDHADAWDLLGVLAHKSGDNDRAVDCLARAVAARPNDAVLHNHLGAMHFLRSDFAAALACHQEAVRLDPGLADAHNNLGNAYTQMGELEKAETSFEMALQLRPDFAQARSNLGTVLKNLGKLQRAEDCCRKALRLNPNDFAAVSNLALVLKDRGKVDEATTYFREALRLRPDWAEAHANLGISLVEQGKTDETARHCREALRLEPDMARVYATLGTLAAQGRYQFSGEEIERIKALLAKGDVSARDAAPLHFTMAGVCDRLGQIDEAFAHYREANDQRLVQFRERGEPFEPEAHRQLTDDVIATFNRDYFNRFRGLGLDTELPLFIVGMPRSGTTLVEQILSSHPQVFGAGELGDIPEIVVQLPKTLETSEPFPVCLSCLDGPAVRTLAAGQLQRLVDRGGQALRVTDKLPRNYLFLGLIWTLFPRARVIHCVRDPTDTCLSCYQQNFESVNFAASLEDLGFYYRQYQRLMAHWDQVLPGKVFQVRYEDMVADQEGVSREMVAFCGLDWDARCLAFYENPRVVRTASTLQVRRPMYRSSVSRWKRYEAHLKPLIDALAGAQTERAPMVATGGLTVPGSSAEAGLHSCEDTKHI